MSLSDHLRFSLPQHGGFYLLHPADSRVLLSNVSQLLQHQESFQLWCQHQVALITHCLRQMVDLEYNFQDYNVERTLHRDSLWTRQMNSTITAIRTILQQLLNTLRKYRFDHHRPDHFHRIPTRLYQNILAGLTIEPRILRDHSIRTRSAPANPRWRTYPRTAMPYDYQMWRRGLHPQFNPASDSES